MKTRTLSSSFSATTKALLLCLFLNQIITARLHAQPNFRVIHSFGILTNDGAFSLADLILSGSRLYGTTQDGGSAGSSDGGTVLKVNTDGSGYAVLKNFPATIYNPTTGLYTNSDGANPSAGLTLSGSTLYGTTRAGDSSGSGTVVKLNTDGTGFASLHSFPELPLSYLLTNSEGGRPYAGLTLSGSTLYGTTYYGVSSGGGTEFEVNTDGSGFTVLRDFFGSGDGVFPLAGLTLSDSTLYGTTYQGGSSDRGTVFKLNTDGSGYTVLKNFTFTEGYDPLAGVTLAGSTLYGTTTSGGGSGGGTVFKLNTDGSGYTVLKNFTGSDGVYPKAGLILSGSTLYGTTFAGGDFNYGVLFAQSIYAPIPLNIQRSGSGVILSWSDTAFALQSAPAATGTFTNIPGATSPHTNSVNTTQQFFRLIAN